jgi:hypothetical protein
MLKLVPCSRSWMAVWPAVVAVLALSASAARGQEAAPPAAADQAAEAALEPSAEASDAPSFRGRLPNYHREVVDQDQRETIYKLQADYAPRIAELRSQLDALIAERDRKIAAVLTPEQRRKIEQIRAAAQAARERRRAESDKPGS